MSASRNETGMLWVGVYPDPADGKHLVAVEAAVSREYLMDVHRAGAAYLESEEVLRGGGGRSEEVLVEFKGGFLYKPE